VRSFSQRKDIKEKEQERCEGQRDAKYVTKREYHLRGGEELRSLNRRREPKGREQETNISQFWGKITRKRGDLVVRSRDRPFVGSLGFNKGRI